MFLLYHFFQIRLIFFFYFSLVRVTNIVLDSFYQSIVAFHTLREKTKRARVRANTIAYNPHELEGAWTAPPQDLPCQLSRLSYYVPGITLYSKYTLSHLIHMAFSRETEPIGR